MRAGWSGTCGIDRYVRPSGRIGLVVFIILLLSSLSLFSPARADDMGACNSQSWPPDEAVAACNRLIASGKFRGSDLANRYVDRGIHWRRKGDPDRALADYNQAIALDPKLAVAYLNRGNTWSAKGQSDSALADYDKAITLASSGDRNLFLAYYNRGNIWRMRGELDRALADLDKALGLDPSNPDVYNTRGSVWDRLGNPDRAMEDYNRAIVLRPGFAVALRN